MHKMSSRLFYLQSRKPLLKSGRESLWKSRRLKWDGFFVAPFLIGFVLIYLPLIFDSIKFSFSEIQTQPGSGYITEFIGFENYSAALLEDPDFVKSLVTTLGELALNIPATVIFALFMAIMLNQKMRGRAVFRAIFFIPVIVSTGIIDSIDARNTLADVMQGVTDTTGGAIEGASSGSEFISAIDVARFFSGMQIGTEMVTWIQDLVNNVYDIVNRSGCPDAYLPCRSSVDLSRYIRILLYGGRFVLGDLLEDNLPDDQPDDPRQPRVYGHRLVYVKLQYRHKYNKYHL